MPLYNMKLYLMFLVFLLEVLHSYEAKGIRIGKVLTLSNQEIKISSIRRSNNDHELIAKPDELKSGINRKLMTKTESSISTTYVSKNHKNEENRNDQKSKIKSANGPMAYKDSFMFSSSSENSQHEKDIVANEPNPKDIDIIDYTPARNKSPIHN